MTHTLYRFLAITLLLGWTSPALAQQKPMPAIIYCQDAAGSFSPCQGGNQLDYDTSGATANQGTVGIVVPSGSGPVAAGTNSTPFVVGDQGVGDTSDAAATAGGTGSLNAKLRLLTDLTNQILTELGQKTEPANNQNVTGTVTANIGTTNGLHLDSTFTGRFPAGFSSADDISAKTATAMHGFLYGWDSGGSNWDRIQVTAGAMNVNLQNSSVAVTGAFWQATQPVSLATNQPVGTVAHDGADSGSPLKIGMKATTSISGKTMVANDDRTDTFAGIDGVPIVRPHSNLEDRVSNVVGVTDGSSTSLVSAQGAGIRFCATTLVVSNSSATNVTVDIRDGTAGSVLMTIPAAANMGGAVIPLQTPLCTSANTAMAQDPSAAATTVTVSVVGFKTKL